MRAQATAQRQAASHWVVRPDAHRPRKRQAAPPAVPCRVRSGRNRAGAVACAAHSCRRMQSGFLANAASSISERVGDNAATRVTAWPQRGTSGASQRLCGEQGCCGSAVAAAAHEVAADTASVKVSSNGAAEAMRRKLRSPCMRRCCRDAAELDAEAQRRGGSSMSAQNATGTQGACDHM